MNQIYLSYAYIDNQNFEEGKRGWINDFKDDLETKLAFALGKVLPISFFHNRQFGKPNLLTIKHIKDAQVFLVIGTPAYFFSEYCQSELQLFMKRKDCNPNQHILFINKLPFDDLSATALIDEKNFHQFYDFTKQMEFSRTHSSDKYSKKLERVAQHIRVILNGER